MMSLSRFALGAAVLILASLTPSSCSDVAEKAMAYEDTEASAAMDEVAMERTMQVGRQLDFDKIARQR